VQSSNCRPSDIVKLTSGHSCMANNI
jgi:hypothetical protein